MDALAFDNPDFWPDNAHTEQYGWRTVPYGLVSVKTVVREYHENWNIASAH